MSPSGRSAPEFVALPRFEIVRHLGSGGMGSVYEAIDRELDARVALKRLDRCEPEQLIRFKREFRDFQDLSHPNLVVLRELFSDGGEWFFSMELLDGVNFLEYVRPSKVSQTVDEVNETATATVTGDSPVDVRPVRQPKRSRVARGAVDEQRLRRALPQLALGIQALHDAGKLHCDVKPSNVLVTCDGRVVLLDYGVALDLDDGTRARRRAGTIAYMAPEQAACRPTGRAADWYAVGVVLYEALTGRLPHEGTAWSILDAKQRRDLPSPCAIEPTAPRDLSELSEELLEIEPSSRPSGAEVLARLGVGATASRRRSRPSQFVGRASHLSELTAAYEHAREQATLVLVYGESGIGKSALVRHFVNEVERDGVRAVVLAGTCYERESVPYKAFDGVIDSLVSYLESLSDEEAARLIPDRISLVAHAFPVLWGCRAIRGAASKDSAHSIDPREQRGRVFAALREVFQRICAAAPLVVTIDDLQWADADSLALLSELMAQPGAPRLLLVATVRTDNAERDSLERLQLGDLARDAILVRVERLQPDEARTLARQLVRERSSSSQLDCDAVAHIAEGHPLFLDTLVRPTSLGSDSNPLTSLAEALWARIAPLPLDARRILELVAIASGRVAYETIANAAGLSVAALGDHVAALRASQLLVTFGSGPRDHVAPYHEQIRRAVLAHVEASTLRGHHRCLAEALEATRHTDPEALTVHWREAGELARAARFARFAAEKSAAALAFDRAAAFYAQCRALLGKEAPRELIVGQAEALANAGRGGESGIQYLLAAVGAGSQESIELRRRAAEQLLRSGHVDEGIAALRDVLATVGIKVATSPMRALASLLGRRARIALRGLRFREVDESRVPPETLTKIDTCWAVAACLSMVDTIRGADFQARHLMLALDAGEPYRVARALALEGGYQSLTGAAGTARAVSIIDEANTLAARIGNSHAIGLASLMTGIAAFQASQWRVACERLADAEATLRSRCTGVAWELTSLHVFQLNATYYAGKLAELQERVPALIKEARSRGDRYATTDLQLSNLNAVWLAQNNVAAARHAVGEAMAQWSARGYLDQHFYALIAQTNIDLYAGDGVAAYRRLTEQWPAIKKAMLLRIQSIRVVALQMRAYAAIAAAKALGPALLAAADRDADALAKEGVEWATAFARAVQAATAAARRQVREAVDRLASARFHFIRADMPLFAAACARHRNVIVGGDKGLETVRVADETLRAQNIANPERFAAMLVTGFGS
jgi:serine/threonine protein kinase